MVQGLGGGTMGTMVQMGTMGTMVAMGKSRVADSGTMVAIDSGTMVAMGGADSGTMVPVKSNENDERYNTMVDVPTTTSEADTGERTNEATL